MRWGRWGQFLRNALVLSLSGLVLRCVSVSFNVYLTDKLGADGIGLYSLVMSVYSFAVTVATSGINLAATRMVAEALGDEDHAAGDVRRAMRCCLGYSAAFGAAASALLIVLAPYISTHWLEDDRTLPALRLLGLSLLPIALSSAMGGYFSGVRRVHKTAAVQLLEQGARVVLTISALQVFLPRGLKYACIGVVLGGMLAEFISFFLLFFAFLRDRRKNFPPPCTLPPAAPARRRLLSVALPVAISAYARSLLVTVEHLLIPICLRKNGSTRDASLAAYGTLHSMVLPILLFPSALLSSVSGLLIPEMAEYRARGEGAQIRRVASRVIQLTLIFSIGTAGVMSCHAYSLGMVIYGSTDAADYIRLLAPLVPVMYLDGTVDAMLKGLGEQVYSMNVNILDALLSVLLVLILLPRHGIGGYVAVLYVCEAFNAVCSIYRLLGITSVDVDVIGWVGQPLCAIVGATMVTRLFGMRYPALDTLSLTGRIAVTVGVYLVLLGGMELLRGGRGESGRCERRKVSWQIGEPPRHRLEKLFTGVYLTLCSFSSKRKGGADCGPSLL